MYHIVIKSGTNGYSHPENEDKLVQRIASDHIPFVGDIIEIDFEDTKTSERYIVKEIKRKYYINRGISFETINVYVVDS